MDRVAFFIKDIILPIYICGAGISYVQYGTNRSEGYCDYQWIQTKSGSGYLEIYDKVYEIGDNQGFLIPPNCKHNYYPSKKGWIQDWISFNGNNVTSYYESLKINSFEIFNLNNNIIPPIIDKIIDTKSSTKQSALIVEILCLISEFKSYSGSNISKVLDFIEINYNKELTLTSLANQLEITPQHFCKIFSQQMNMRPFEYLNEFRIKKSKELLLLDIQMPLIVIAEAVGFTSSSYFCKTFKKYEGMSPGNFRELFCIKYFTK